MIESLLLAALAAGAPAGGQPPGQIDSELSPPVLKLGINSDSIPKWEK